jgi:protein SCO1/2
MHSLRWLSFLILLSIGGAACSSSARNENRVYTLQGQVLSIDPARKTATIKHEEITGFMPAMTMPYEAKETRVLEGLAPGDLITAKLTVEPAAAYLTEVRKVGTAPLGAPPVESAEPAPSASSGFELIKQGEPVPDARFLDQNGNARTFSSFKGHTVVMTFIYTRCPMPTFCPLMDRHFAAIQKTLQSDPALKDVRLVSVSFDPLTDTPPVLLKHAQELGADPRRWTFLTGDRDDIDKFGARFGVSVERAMNDQRDITHNLRTVIVGADGRLVKVYTGNEWTPEQVVADLKEPGTSQGRGIRD